MSYLISGYEPASLFRYFEDICKIPHGSGNEEKIADYLCDFARSRGLFFLRDDLNNVFMRKDATVGYEDHPPVLLQGHMDMVCEKNKDTVHDFEKDPLDLTIENGWLRAKGTTLGGDDGAAVAMMLAALSDESLPHPMLECLFTTGEETRMAGADGFDYSVVKSRKLINLDSEAEGVVTVSCAGGTDLALNYPVDRIKESGRTLRISVKGLAGGHSGAEIHLCRGNACRILARLLSVLYEDEPFHLISISGGNKRNAIPREAEAEISVLDEKRATEVLLAEERRISAELSPADRSFRVHVGKGCVREEMFSYKDTSAVLNLLLTVPNGVIAMSPTVENFVRTSSNIGILTTDETGVHLGIMARSSQDSELDAQLIVFRRLAKLIGAEYVLEDHHAGWELCPDSQLTRDYVEVWKALYPEKEPIVCGIHAGLECGIILSKLDGPCDAISIGPDMQAIHTPDEALSLISCQRTYALLAEMLKRA
ncbi:MAG: beta-Ala-His dipeptidase [Eubacteriales bacterium]